MPAVHADILLGEPLVDGYILKPIKYVEFFSP